MEQNLEILGVAKKAANQGNSSRKHFQLTENRIQWHIIFNQHYFWDWKVDRINLNNGRKIGSITAVPGGGGETKDWWWKHMLELTGLGLTLL